MPFVRSNAVDLDELIPLPQWIADGPTPRTRWALQAILALNDATAEVRWNGDMRHLPSVGVALSPPATNPYLVVKQDNNGTTFVIASVELALPADEVAHRAHKPTRLIGAWTHPSRPTSKQRPTGMTSTHPGGSPRRPARARSHRSDRHRPAIDILLRMSIGFVFETHALSDDNERGIATS